MKTLVAATDFSPGSLNAVRYAADMACYLKADLVLLHVCPIPDSINELAVTDEGLGNALICAGEEIELLKKELLRITGEKIIILTEVRVGDVAGQLKDFCETIHPYAVVMGPCEAGGAETLLYGSTCLQAVRDTRWPLLIVPSGIRFKQIRKVVMACDLKDIPESIPIDSVKRLVQDFRAHLYVLHINETGQSLSELAFSDAFKKLGEIMKDLHPAYRFTGKEAVDKGILSFVERNSFDLLIVLPKIHSLPARLFHKSHSRQLVLQTHTPVLSLHN